MKQTHPALALALLSGMAFALTGCHGKANKGLGSYTELVDEAAAAGIQIKKSLDDYNKPDATEEQRKRARNRIIDNGIMLITNDFARRFDRTDQTKKWLDFGANSVAIGLNTAGAVLTPATTVRILSALSAGVLATNAASNETFFFDAGIEVILSKMEASRERIETRLFAGRALPTSEYGMGQALVDLGKYYRAGTITGAFASVSTDAGKEKAEAEEKEGRRLEDAAARINRILTDYDAWLKWLQTADNGQYLREWYRFSALFFAVPDDSQADFIWGVVRERAQIGLTSQQLATTFPQGIPNSPAVIAGLNQQDLQALIERFYAMIKEDTPANKIVLARGMARLKEPVPTR
ncbi:MAG: hypothetical protein AAFR96_02745 [Planctomycetota bacterium]